MDRLNTLKDIYSKKRLIRNFDFDALYHQPLCYYMTEQDIAGLHYLATSAKFGGMSKNEKVKLMGDILGPRGFKCNTTGTNRAIFRYEDDRSFIIKVAMDEVGCRDNPDELFNQQIMKPFVPKIFDVSPCGTVQMAEAVTPIQNRYEFELIAEECFDILQNFFLGRYVLEDIGTDFFRNWGLRDGFGPVLLDFPYLYEIDGSKLRCTKIFADGHHCTGEIDYDNGLNTLVCEKCGQRYAAKDLGSANGTLSVRDKKEVVSVMENFTVGTVIKGVKYDLDQGVDFIRPTTNKPKGNKEFTVEVCFPKNRQRQTQPVEEQKGPAKLPIADPPNVDIKPKEVVHKEVKEEMVTQEEKVSVELSTSSQEAFDEAKVASAKDIMLINGFMKESMENFDFDSYPVHNSTLKNVMTDFLFGCVMGKFYSIDGDKANELITEFIEKEYTFISEEEEAKLKSEQLAKQYMGEEEEYYAGTQKIGRRSVRDDL